jgi:histidinol-phosphate phosphatase family protein
LVRVAGTPLVERQIALLVRYGVDEIFLTTGYGADVLAERLGAGSRLGVRLQHVRETTPLGTAGGVAALRDRIRGDFLVLYGDVVVNMDLARLLDFHRRAGADATLVVHPNDHPYDSDLVDLDAAGRVRAFHPKPRPDGGPDLPNLVSAGLYVLSPAALEHIEVGVHQDFVKDVFPRMQAAGARLCGYRTTEYLKDTGTVERLEKVERDLESGKVNALHGDHLRPTVFLDRDGVIIAEVNGVHEPDQLELLDGATRAIRRLNQAGWLVGVVTNQPDVAKGFLDESELERIHHRLERRLGDEGAWLDGLAYCPHHPERNFAGERPELKIACACRKPQPGLLAKLAEQLPVEREASVVIGDSWRDMAAAHAYGVDAIGVCTGHKLSQVAPDDWVVPGRPDVVMEDLEQAVALLLDRDRGVEALAQRVRKELDASRERPLAVFVGGLARVGKSATVFRLRRLLRAQGLVALWIRLDDWLLPAEVRPTGSRVAERYRAERIQEALGALVQGKAVDAPGYDPRSRGALPAVVPYDPAGADVLLVEGVPALLLDAEPCHALRVHLDAPSEEKRLARVTRFYRHKGLSDGEIRTLIESRAEEHTAILAAAATSEIRFEPRLFGAREDAEVES